MNISVLILTYNEAANLPACLEALAQCDDIVVIDSGSRDGTVEIARERGAKVLVRPFDNFAAQRNFGLLHGDLRHDWVLHLDADEVLTDDFLEKLRQLDPPPEVDAYRVPSKLMLFGQWLQFSGMYPSYQVRIGRRDKLRFKQVGHGQREDLAPERVGLFAEPYLHFSFSHGMRRWLEKHIRYASDEADLMLALRGEAMDAKALLKDPTERRRAVKAWSARLPFALRPALRFIYVYFYRQGFRDGWAGLTYALMISVYEGMIAVFAYESLMAQKPQDGANTTLLVRSSQIRADSDRFRGR
jgi:glycosyltransferase involved in cell wall biosynthesis